MPDTVVVLEDLAKLVDVDRFGVRVDGPSVWWTGPLNVEGLALESVRCAVIAANARGAELDCEVRADLVAANFGSFSHLRIDGRQASGFAEMSRFFACVDGWLRTHANFPHHREALCRVFGVRDRAGLAQALAEVAALDAEAAVLDNGGVAAAVRSRAAWSASPQGRAVAREPWIRFKPGDREQSHNLNGLRVLDFTRVIAGPIATRFLAAVGADVLRVDPPGMPELLDQYLDTGAGKRSALADLNDSATLERVKRLAAEADVVILGYRPGALAKFGLDPEQLHAELPHLAVVHIDAWGNAGPWANLRGFDSIVQAATGIAETYRQPDGAPGALPVQALDHATGYGAAAAALALLERGGIAHLSLARTAEELYDLPPATGSPATVKLPMVSVESPHGTIEQVRPIVGQPASPGGYGEAPLSWLTRSPTD